MKPLATYYKLVDRDTEKVGAKWKVMSCFVLVIAVVASAIVSFCFYSLEHAFGDRCVLNANPSLIASTTETKNLLDILNTKWGLNEDCNFAIFTPLFQSMTGIIWISLFLVCGNGGASNKASIPKPYQIVVPVTLYLLAMICLSAYEVPFISDGLSAFCINFINQTFYVNETTDGCGALLDKYTQAENQLDAGTVVVDDKFLLPPSWHYYLTIAFIWTTLAAFLLAFLIMVLRCLFVVDFELIKITIANQEVEEDKRVLQTEDDNMTNSSTPSLQVLRNVSDSRIKPRRRVLVVDEHDAKYVSSNSETSSLVKSDQIPFLMLNDVEEPLSERPRRPTKVTMETKDL